MKNHIHFIAILSCLLTSITCSAEISSEKVQELSDSLFIKKRLMAMVLISRREFNRFGPLSSITKKTYQVKKDIIEKIQPMPLYNEIIKTLKNDLTSDQANALIEYSKLEIHRKYLMKHLYLATDEGYKLGKKIANNFELGIFQPDDEKYKKITHIYKSSHHLELGFRSAFYYNWLTNVEFGKVYPQLEVSKEKFTKHFIEYRTSQYDDHLENLMLKRYLSLESFSDQEIKEFNDNELTDSMVAFDTAFQTGYINFLSKLTDKPVPKYPY